MRRQITKTISIIGGEPGLLQNSVVDFRNPEPEKNQEEVDFLQLPDGTLVETIADPSRAGKTKLAIFQNGEFRIQDRFTLQDRTLVPLDGQSCGMPYIHLADGIEPAGGAEDLFTSLMALLQPTIDISEEHVCALSAWVLGTWFVSNFPIAPYVSFVGPPGSGKTTALRVMRLICWRALATSDITSAAFYDISTKVGTTLLLDEAATLVNRREIFHLLRAGSTPGFAAFRKKEAFTFFGARAFSWTELPDDVALNSRSLIIPMKCSMRRDLLPVDHPPLVAGAEKLQRQLLEFRLRNFTTLRANPIVGEENLQPRSRDQFRCLCAPIRKVPDLVNVIRYVFQQQDDFRGMINFKQAAVAGAVFQVSHEHREGNWQISFRSLKQLANLYLRERDEPPITSEKSLGHLLTTIGFIERKSTNTGTVLILNRATRERAHALQRMHKIATSIGEGEVSSCKLCQASIL